MRSLVVLAFLSSCGGARPSQRPPERSPSEVASVPFENDFNLIFVQVVVGDAPPRWFLLDSGADQTLLDRDAAREFGVRFGGDAQTAQPGGDIAIAHAHDVTFRVGGAAFVAADVWVTPLKGLHRFVGRPFDGLLGHAFLERYVTKVSYDTRRITLYEPARFDYRGSGESVPVEIVNAEAFIHAAVDSGTKRVDARLKLDTGSIDTLGLNGSFVVHEQLFDAKQARVPRMGVAIGGATEGYLTRIPSLTIGSRALGPLVIGYSAETQRTGDAGTIGAEVLHRFTVIFDYTRHRLILEPGAALAKPFPVDASGLFGATFEDDLHRFVILSVTPGSPAADAGVAAGDEVVAIDGTPFSHYGLRQLFARVRVPGHLQLTVRRDGTVHPVDLTLRPLI